MGFFDLFKRAEEAENSIQMTDALLEAFLQDDHISRKMAMNVPTFAGCINTISNTVASVPIYLLIHQGESNSDDPKWPERVAKIYHDLCTDLGLNPKDVPLLAGELKHQEQGGICWKFNVDILPNLPKTLPNSYIISSKDCQSTGDQFHFSTEGMRTLGYRYAEQMLKLHKYKKKK